MIPRWQNDAESQKLKASSLPRWLIAAIVISAAAVVYVLQARFLPINEVSPLGLSTNDIFNDSIDDAASEDRFRLHPARHALRDSTTLRHHWRITSGERRPDGVLKRVYLINGEFPGPTIEVRSGDRLVVEVENALEDEGVAMHWHGLTMLNFNAMDGAAGITQDPIKSGESFTYDFAIDPDQHGTFWYHAHEGVQRADGLYGGLVVHQPAQSHFDFADEHLILVGDHYHRPATEALDFYMHPGAFGLETVPDSMLVNGKGHFECSRAVPARPLNCQDEEMASLFSLDGTKRNVLRVVNVGAYAGLSLGVHNSMIKPFAVDGGHLIRGNSTNAIGVLHPGERVDLSVQAGSARNTSITIALDDAPFKYQNPALNSTQTFPITWTGDILHHSDRAAEMQFFDLQQAMSFHDQSGMISRPIDSTIVLYAVTQKLAHLDNVPLGFINRTTWHQPTGQPLISIDAAAWNTKEHFISALPYNSSSPIWVDVVLNNLDEEGHPFHMHGYSFHVLSTHTSEFNWGSYNPFEDSPPPGGPYDLSFARKKDTVFVPRRGYAILRLEIDNPGIWAFHCHVLWHMGSGMAMAFDVR